MPDILIVLLLPFFIPYHHLLMSCFKTCLIMISYNILYRKYPKLTVNIPIIYCVTNAKSCDVKKTWHLAKKRIVTQ